MMADDVLFTGRTIRAGLDAMLAFGRTTEVEVMKPRLRITFV